MMNASSLNEKDLIGQASACYAIRRVPRHAMRGLLTGVAPRSGDVVLAIVKEMGQHKRLHLPDGSKRNLFVGDLILVTYADRYAPNQFEAFVPPDLRECHLVAAGGIAGRVVHQHDRIRRGATRIQPLGLVTSDPGAPPLNVAGWSLGPLVNRPKGDIPLLAVVGTSMDSGKTTSAAYLVHGLRRYGLRVGYAKVTGTGAAGDPCLLRDAGASPVLDFTDAGYASTYQLPANVVESLFGELVAHQENEKVDAIVVEIADGLLQKETAGLLESRTFRELAHGILFAAGESLGAVAGVDWLTTRGLPLRGLCGRLTTSPLQMREARAGTGLPIYSLNDLDDPATAAKVLYGC